MPSISNKQAKQAAYIFYNHRRNNDRLEIAPGIFAKDPAWSNLPGKTKRSYVCDMKRTLEEVFGDGN